MNNSKMLIAILVILILIAFLLTLLLLNNITKSHQNPSDISKSSATTTTTTTTAKLTTTRPTTTTTTTTTTTITTKSNSTNINPPEDTPGVYDMFTYDIDPDNDGYRILALDPDFLSWQSPPSELIIPQFINGIQVTAIGNSAFKGVQSTKIILPEGIIDIYKNAFYNCGAQEISIPNTVRYIGSSAFQKCHFLKNITIPEGVDIIRDNTFRECTYLESIKLPSTLTYIGNYAFAQCQTLTNIKIPSGCEFEDTAFSYSPNIMVE